MLNVYKLRSVLSFAFLALTKTFLMFKASSLRFFPNNSSATADTEQVRSAQDRDVIGAFKFIILVKKMELLLVHLNLLYLQLF